jgi:hypothetical protein
MREDTRMGSPDETTTGTLRYYSMYDLVVESEFELPELPRVNSGTIRPDISIQRGDVEPVAEFDSGTGISRIDAAPSVCRATYDSIGSFLITDGERILVDVPSPDVLGKKIFRRILQNELMAVLLMQRGLLVLHGSAVTINGKAVIFLGDRGAGKSTTAAAFHSSGHSVLEDDTVAIRFSNGQPMVVPGVPQLRLSPDAVRALGFTGATTPTDDWGPLKQYLETATVSGPAPLMRCYLIQEGGQLEFKQIPPRNRPFVLITSTYTQGMLPDTDATSEHFKQCATVVESTPIKRLVRPKNYAGLPSLVELVVNDIA